MRVHLDEDLDVNLRHEFSEGFDVETVQYRGGKGLKNGELLTLASREFDALITMDDSLPDQRNLDSYGIAVVILRAASKDLSDLRELVPETERILPTLEDGDARRVQPPA